MTQDAARIDAEQQFDLIDPTRMEWGEVEDEPVAVARIEIGPDLLCAVSIEVVPHAMHAASGVGLRDLLHEGNEIILRAPRSASADDAP